METDGPAAPDPEKEQLKKDRKTASQIGLLLGGIAFTLGAITCLIYLLIYKPYKIPDHLLQNPPVVNPDKGVQR